MASKSKYHKLLRIIYGGLNIDAVFDNWVVVGGGFLVGLSVNVLRGFRF